MVDNFIQVGITTPVLWIKKKVSNTARKGLAWRLAEG